MKLIIKGKFTAETKETNIFDNFKQPLEYLSLEINEQSPIRIGRITSSYKIGKEENKVEQKEIESFCQEAINKNKEAVIDYKDGNEKAIHFLVGYVVRMVEGQTNKELIELTLKHMLKAIA